MKALQITGPRGMCSMLELPIQQPGPGEVLIRIEAVATCPQWDLHLSSSEPMFPGHVFHYPYPPGQPGHEAAGQIEAAGPGVEGLKTGDRVSIWRDPGHSVQGCYAQYVVRPAEQVLLTPPHLRTEQTVSLELAMCVGASVLMLRKLGFLQGKRVGVTGLGPAGLVALQMARSEEAAETTGFDPLPSRRELARSLGFEAFSPAEAAEQGWPLRPLSPKLDTVIDCAGSAEAVAFSMDAAKEAAALFGVQRETYLYEPRHYNGLTLCGYPGHHKSAAEYALELIVQKKLQLAPLITHTLPLQNYQQGLALLQNRQAVKVCFLPWA